ncbi:HEPN domain-containing protein [Aeromonas sp. DNP9]|uniref:HEPN domain-containing protein n=1 Tax=Aeromonas sp. DNP9 TaxID=1535548 RepID=UPI00084B335E|nr:HEPN domain-containing protein [Aeromonas sp. DNP9]OEC42024.1 hypothetical protein A9G06_20285 [Aeromonas sp. DNP9]
MKLEFLVLITNNDSFCNSKKAFIDFLKVDSLISISGQKITYKKTSKSKPLITVKFRVETDNIPSNKERYFIVALENTNDQLVDEFSEVGDKIKQICKRINPESTVINVLWDDVGRHYAYKAYPLINDIENVMRKLISKFMLINVGINWSKETIHPDLAKKIEKFDEDDIHLNDLYKLDFINLSQVLFQKKRDITLEELDRVLAKTAFDESDKSKILKYVPKSNWEKYFSSLLGIDSQSLEKKWDLLYKLRNKVAHNRFLTREDFEKVNELTSEVKEKLTAAMSKLGEIDLDEEDRELIIHSYKSESLHAFFYLAEKSVAEFYLKKGANIEPPERSHHLRPIDFLVKTQNQTTAIEIKCYYSRFFSSALAMRLGTTISHVERYIEQENIDFGEVVIVLRDDPSEILNRSNLERLASFKNKINPKINIMFGTINERNEFEPVNIPVSNKDL